MNKGQIVNKTNQLIDLNHNNLWRQNGIVTYVLNEAKLNGSIDKIMIYLFICDLKSQLIENL